MSNHLSDLKAKVSAKGKEIKTRLDTEKKKKKKS